MKGFWQQKESKLDSAKFLQYCQLSTLLITMQGKPGKANQAKQTRTARQINPTPYHASYFGHKLHVDQNEKLVMFGVTHICAIDGYSGKVVGFASLPVKNNIEIYRHIFRYVFQ